MLPSEQWLKILKGLAIAVAGAAVTATAQYVADTDFGEVTGIVVAVNSVLINIARKFIMEWSGKKNNQ